MIRHCLSYKIWIVIVRGTIVKGLTVIFAKQIVSFHLFFIGDKNILIKRVQKEPAKAKTTKTQRAIQITEKKFQMESNERRKTIHPLLN